MFFPLDPGQPSYAWLVFPGSLADRNWPCPAKLSAMYLSYFFLYSSLTKLANLFLQMSTHLGKGRARETDLLGTSLSALPSLPFSVSPRSVQFQSLMPMPSSGPLRSQDGHFLLAITALGELCLLDSKDTCPSTCMSQGYLEPPLNTGSGPADGSLPRVCMYPAYEARHGAPLGPAL